MTDGTESTPNERRYEGEQGIINGHLDSNQGLTDLFNVLDGLKGRGYKFTLSKEWENSVEPQQADEYVSPVLKVTIGLTVKKEDKWPLTVRLGVSGEYNISSHTEPLVTDSPAQAANAVEEWHTFSQEQHGINTAPAIKRKQQKQTVAQAPRHE